MMMPAVTVEFALIEAMHLARLVDEFIDLLGSADAEDPAIARLTPNAYPDDADAASVFTNSTRTDLLDRRLRDAQAVRVDLRCFDPNVDLPSEKAALAPRTVTIANDNVDAWLRTLTALRLVIATRLGVSTEADLDPNDDRFDVYDWLGYRLELIIEASDDVSLTSDDA